MKMVKSLLLGSAAGLVAVTAGQAADLPVKAKPVEYVKVCSIYGAGFYYMPGTDMCIKLGGWMRVEANEANNQTGSLAWGPYNGDLRQRNTNNYQVRARGYVTVDAREQTAYGTARAYLDVGINTSDIGTIGPSNSFSSNRAFVQWAGITAGVTQSFYDFYAAAAVLYRAGYIPSEDSGDGGWWVWAYTAQFGGGFSATISAEERRMTQIVDQNGASTAIGGGFANAILSSNAPSGYGGQQAPDIIGNIRIDQAWGSAQIMGAGHLVNPLYYGGNTGLPITGHPGDKWGFVVGAGLRLNAPMIAQGDYFQGEVNYTQGATKYVNNGEDTNYTMLSGNQEVYGVMSDCVFGGTTAGANATGCNLTTAWGVNVSYEHYWTPQWHESIVGGYMQVNYNDQANAMLCAGVGNGNGGIGTLAAATAGCSNNWSIWGIGSRLQWDITKNLYMGVEALYQHMDGATTSDGAIHGYSLNGAVTSVAGSLDSWSFNARIHKDFLP